MNLLEHLAYSISGRSREKKYRQFLEFIRPQPEETIVDVGVNDEEYSAGDNYLEKHYPFPERITAVSESLDHFPGNHPRVRSVIADGRVLPFTDNQFDIAYSNAVIEHVGGHDAQLAFLQELHRVAKRGYLTTPNRYFPIEPHTRVPLLHILLSKRYFDGFLRFIGKDWATGDYMHLLSKRALKKLIHEAGIRDARIHTNALLGSTLTFTVTWDKL